MTLCRLGSAVAVLALLAPPAHPIGYWNSGTPGPTGVLRVTQPSVRWRVWRGDGAMVTEVRLTLNGAPVPATYAPEERSVVYDPPRPLPPGGYDVACRVAAERGDPIERAWQFSVARGARDRLAPPGPVQQNALAAANAYRRRLSLPLLRLDDRLSAAAAAHVSYLERNRTTGHFEIPGRPGFAGVTPRERKAPFGYFGSGYEAVDYGSRSVVEAVRALFDAPYHRMPFLQPGPILFGAARSGRHTVLEFGASDKEGTVVYPAAGQRDVPVAWDDKERPDPLQIHGARGTVGYPITLFHFAPDRLTMRVTGTTLATASGKPVPFFLNDPENDPEMAALNGVLIIPRRPLPPNTTFNVSVAAQTPLGRTVSRSWSFTTGAAPRPARVRRGPARTGRKRR